MFRRKPLARIVHRMISDLPPPSSNHTDICRGCNFDQSQECSGHNQEFFFVRSAMRNTVLRKKESDPGRDAVNRDTNTSPGALTKFEALRHLAQHEGVDQVLFVGDDDTDEIVFQRAPRHWTTVRIDPHGGTAARFCLEEQASIEILLAHLLADHAGRASDMGVRGSTSRAWRVAADLTVHEVAGDLVVPAGGSPAGGSTRAPGAWRPGGTAACGPGRSGTRTKQQHICSSR